jgi:methylmalonyl-CoA/ethylmalonyl-CoA epimerase
MAKLPPVDHVGIVVKDIDKAVKFYETAFGWGPFKVMETPTTMDYNGKPENVRMKIALAQCGPLQIELIQVLEGETPHSKFLREKGEGLQHLRCCVENVDSVLAELAKEGIKPVLSKQVPGMGTMFAYVDSDKVGGVMMEILNAKVKIK